MLLIGALLFFMFRQAQGTNNQALSFGKSRARMFLGNKTVVTFQVETFPLRSRPRVRNA